MDLPKNLWTMGQMLRRSEDTLVDAVENAEAKTVMRPAEGCSEWGCLCWTLSDPLKMEQILSRVQHWGSFFVVSG